MFGKRKAKPKKERLSSKEEKEVLPLFMYNEPQIFASFSRFFGRKFVKSTRNVCDDVNGWILYES